METISPELPKNVSSPPLSPFNITIAQHQHILPPIRSLPSWNRTKLGIKRTTEPIGKNLVKEKQHTTIKLVSTQLEQCTQTSRESSRQSSVSSASRLSYSKTKNTTHSAGNLKSLYEKKIIFLQSTHSEVLKDLQEELDQLKSQNKGLAYFLIFFLNYKIIQLSDSAVSDSAKPYGFVYIILLIILYIINGV